MPSKSASQHRLMAAVAHNPSFAKKVGIPQSVGRDFTEADKGRKFAKGGAMESKKMMQKEVSFMKEKGAPKSMVKHEMAEMKSKGYAEGGKVDYAAPDARARAAMREVEDAKMRDKMGQAYSRSLTNTPEAPKAAPSAPKPADKKPKAMMSGGCAKGYAKGGMVDGCAQRGKTKGRFI